MDFGLGAILGLLKKIPIIFNKVELSFDVNNSFNEIIYIIKNNGNKNIENVIIKEYKEKNDLVFPTEIFYNFEKKYFIGINPDDFGNDKLYPINFPKKFKNGKDSLMKDLERYITPSQKLKLYCNFIESNLYLLLRIAVTYVNSYYEYLIMVDEINNKNGIMENQLFLDVERLSPNAIKKEEERMTGIIKTYLTNILEFINFIHTFSKNISINHNLTTLKKVFNSELHKTDLKNLIISTDAEYTIENLQFIKNILDMSNKELNVKPNDFLVFNKNKITINESVLIKKPVDASIMFSMKFRNSEEEDTIIKDHSKKIEVKYEEFSIWLRWTILVNAEYKNGIKEKNICIKRITRTRIEISKNIELPEITENSSNLYDKFYR